MQTRASLVLLILFAAGCQDAPRSGVAGHSADVERAIAAGPAKAPAISESPSPDFDETPLPDNFLKGEVHPHFGDPDALWLFSNRAAIGSLLIVPSPAAMERQQERFDTPGDGIEPEDHVIEWPLRGSNGKLRRERLKIGKESYWYNPSTIAYFLPEDGPPLNLPTHEIHADDTGIDVYAEWEGQYDVSPVEDFPLWVNPAEFTEPFSLTFISTAREIVWAAFVHPLPDQPMRLHASPVPNAPLLAEIYAEHIGPPELGGIGADAWGLEDVSADGEWIHVTVTYNTDIWCAGEQLGPDVTGWIRWRNDDGSPRVEWQARFSC